MKYLHLLILTAALVALSSGMLSADDEFIIDEPNYVNSGGAAQSSGASLSGSPTEGSISRIPFIGSIPTTDNLTKGDFRSEFTMYDGGGVNIRMMVGVFGMLSIGISENFDGLIGTEKITVNIPGAYLKFSLYDSSQWLNVSAGFDHFAYGKNGTYFDPNGISSSIYGFYFNIGQNYSLFGENNIYTLGVRVPLLPDNMRNITNSTIFFGATLNTKYLRFGFTLENLYIDFTRMERILPSLIVSFVPVPSFELRFTLQYEFFSLSFNRILSLGYTAKF